MSETDDTDDLLLIPPDFFVVHSEPQPPYYSIVDSLIKQVSNLQDRIEGIESMSDVSLMSSYQDNLQEAGKSTSMFNSKAPFTKRYYSQDDLYQPPSTQSTPQKLEKPRINSLPNTPIINRFSPRKNNVKFNSPQKFVSNPVSQKPSGEETEMLHEIDTFLSNVKAIQRNHTVRNLQIDFDAVRGTTVAQNHNKYVERDSDLQTCNRDVAETIQELNRQSQRIATKETETNGSVQERVNRVNSWQCGDNIGTVPDYGTGIRDHLYKQKESPLKSGHFKPVYQQGSTTTTTDFNSTITTLEKSSDSSSESTQLTAYNRAKKQDFKKFEAEQKINEQFKEVFKKKGVDIVSPESIIDRERSELLHSPLHDNALSVLDMHKKLLESTNAVAKEARVQKKRGINTLSDNLGLVSLADIWGASYMTQSPSKVSQKLQEEKLRRQHCEQLIQELQNKNLELQQKLAVAVKVDDTKNKTIQQFREALDTMSLRMEKLNEQKSTWDREMDRLKKQHSIEIESANQKVAYYENEATRSLNLAHANQEKLSLLEKRCSDLQLELQQIEAKFKDVQECYEKEFEKNKQLADIISQKEIELKENKSVLNNAREEVAHSRKAVEVCQAEFTSLKDECKRLQSDLGEAKTALLTLTEQKRKLLNDIQTYKQNEKTLKEALEQSKLKLESAKLELRNFYQGQLEIIVENKRKEMQSQLDRERQHSLEEVKRKELSMAKTAANHIKEISEKCALETKLLEQKHQEEIRLYQMQLSQTQKEMESLQSKLANLPEKRAQIAKQLQKVMESQWNEALKMINSSPTPIMPVNNEPKNPSKPFHAVAETEPQEELRKDANRFDSVSDYDETPVSSRGAKQSESEIQKYINMLLNRPPGNPIYDAQGPSTFHTTATWNPCDPDNQNKQSQRDRKSGKPPWK